MRTLLVVLEVVLLTLVSLLVVSILARDAMTLECKRAGGDMKCLSLEAIGGGDK